VISNVHGPIKATPEKEKVALLVSISQMRSRILQLESALAAWKRGESKSIEECLDLVESAEGQLNLSQTLMKVPFPHYEAVPGESGDLVRINADGSRARGHFVGRTFQVLESA
jgi:exonuclease VII small subunit